MTEGIVGKIEAPHNNVEIRPVNPNNTSDLDAIQKILRSPKVQFFMDRVENTSYGEIINWANKGRSENSFLFALATEGKVKGFIYFYPSDIVQDAMEVSYAKDPDSKIDNLPIHLQKACLMVSSSLGEFNVSQKLSTKIVAEIEPENTRSIVVAKKAGFEYGGERIWQLNWNKIN